jgi:hypothetical protein
VGALELIGDWSQWHAAGWTRKEVVSRQVKRDPTRKPERDVDAGRRIAWQEAHREKSKEENAS